MPGPGREQSAGALTPEPATRREAAPLALASMVIASSWQAVRRNSMRSALTMLGVLIGVAALIVNAAFEGGWL